MRTSSRPDLISPVSRSQIYYTATVERDTHTAPVASKYDSVTLSADSSVDTFHKTMVGRLSQEIRATTTTGDIRALRQQVAAGTYQPDPSAIAARMLFLEEGV